MSITVRDRRTGRDIDSSYFVKNGMVHDSLERFHVGDAVSIMFSVTEREQKLLRECAPSDIHEFNGKVHIPFTVVGRSHGLTWVSVGVLQMLGSDLKLQATSGEWEDVFKWIACGIVPSWISEEEPDV